ncbi:3-hydroxyisobutyrate dehydrogenase [Legionella pneumophila]|uniref:3-hydroxyisobutyrate dehydrogenase n=1 Tax=Legionella pneumophila subsp. pascullei TaxID=91890 RepID=A0AAX2IT94_LEGPN|nr:3-hydroxyisobutyrate dehydrogenase [Legionella pneumophila]AMP88296.1 3-hydroxyisobutyrate dehydrogenase [Legionella pneumophila subsp. pascullei]AMP91205.1 3-hydroxyisobutyrate dehydrogenase [Legionella pneumophila subsp. pascullei]AMP94192.1 3-hydroxyisobutyrate dehydrogenase [Legionella pneumophila subsp. pascullei]SQG88965.1 3-hydroxyisobutyrate dehydrogenase [Legionella pneumophila subsp. pascullei]VEH04015.1 3-hydroxyisobutyrate dehydrogenase [Legionella pneumophila subsp. pascullei]
MANIGFVGLGHMGFPMAINLLKAGHSVMGYDLQQSALEHFAEQGGAIAHNLQELAKGKDIIVTMLQTGQQVLHVCLGVDGIFSQLNAGSLYIDCSTIDVKSSRETHQIAKENHLLVVDAPVSGGVAGAVAATLTFMVGGEMEAYHAAHPILTAMGKKIIHTGGAGSGQAAKICNNMILGTTMIAISEAFILAKELGLSNEKLFEVVNNSSGQCWAMSKYVPVPGILENVPANNDYKPGFAAKMMLKDLLLSQNTAKSVHIETPLGAKTTEIYQQFIDKGLGDVDFSAIIKQIAKTQEV